MTAGSEAIAPAESVSGAQAGSTKLQSLQALRAIAVLLVVMFHTQATFADKTGAIPFGGVFGGGGRGVDLFFVLSGFIIMYVHGDDWGRPGRLAMYLFNRFSRIYPSVWIVTGATALLVAAGLGGAYSAGKLQVWNVIATAFLLPQHGNPLVLVTWTLKLEMFFYLVFALCIATPSIGRPVLLVWIASIVGLALLGIPTESLWFGFYLQPIGIEFGLGMGCAWFYRNGRWRGIITPVWCLGLLALGAIAFGAASWIDIYAVTHAERPVDTLAFGMSSAVILLSLTMLESTDTIRAPRFLVMVGDASYAIYLVHFAVVSRLVFIAGKLHHGPAGTLACFAVAAFAVAVGSGFDRLVDQPLQRALRRLKMRALRAPSRREANLIPKSRPA